MPFVIIFIVSACLLIFIDCCSYQSEAPRFGSEIQMFDNYVERADFSNKSWDIICSQNPCLNRNWFPK